MGGGQGEALLSAPDREINDGGNIQRILEQ
jgi:hypothetical protein